MESKSHDSLTARFLCLSLGGEEFGLPMASVREVIAMPKTRPLPMSHVAMVGLTNLRGQVIPIIDLATKFKLKVKPDNSEKTVIICEIHGQAIGVVVDSVNSVFMVERQEISDLPAFNGGPMADFLTGVHKMQNQLVLLLDLSKVFSEEDRQLMDNAVQKVSA